MPNNFNQVRTSSPNVPDDNKSGLTTTILIFVGLIVVAAIGFFVYRAVGPDSPDAVTGTTSVIAETPLSEVETAPLMEQNVSADAVAPVLPLATPVSPDTVREFIVSGENFSFTPNEIRVQKGETVRIVFNNTGGMHDWRLDEFAAGTQIIKEGESDTVGFVADQAGSFEFYCSVGQHRQLGMTGTLIVE
jgi:plastocyanin